MKREAVPPETVVLAPVFLNRLAQDCVTSSAAMLRGGVGAVSALHEPCRDIVLLGGAFRRR